jgi:hypothetical protein
VLDRDLRTRARTLGTRARAATRANPRWLALALLAALALAVPVVGVAEKLISGGIVVLDPNRSLGTWGGDLTSFFPEYEFLSLKSATLWPLATVAMVAFAYLAVRERPRELRFGIFAVLAIGALAALDFRLRSYGYYFHFKVLAFIAPLLVVCAAVGISRLPWRGAAWVILGGFALLASGGALNEAKITFDQTPKTLLALRDWSRAIPRGASVRLDMAGGNQLWAGYMLAAHRTCAQLPLLYTDYPHVAYSAKADYALVKAGFKYGIEPVLNPPFGAIGPPVFRNEDYALYRLTPSLPGKDSCSQRLVQTVTSVPLS